MAARDEKNRKRNQSGSYYTYGNVAYELQPDYTPYRVREEEAVSYTHLTLPTIA